MSEAEVVANKTEVPRTEGAGSYSHQIVAAPEEIDELGHVNNTVYVRWMQDISEAHSAARGWDHAAYKRIGAIFVVRRHEIEYLRPVMAGETITVTTTVTGWKGASAQRHTSFRRGGVEVARGETQWVFVAMPEARPRRIPKELRAAFGVEEA